MPKRKPDRELIRITKIDYTPHQMEKDAFSKPLITIIWGVNRLGRRVALRVRGCLPRIWVGENPYGVDIPENLQKYIVKIKKSGKALVTQQNLWCIYVKYPFGSIIRPLRELFKYTCQADVYFHDAVRSFYGLQAYISIPRGKYELHINDIKNEKIPAEVIPTNAYILDIETSDRGGFTPAKNPTAPIRNLTLRSIRTGAIYQAIATNVDKQEVIDGLCSQEWLEDNIDHTAPIEPVPKDTKIVIDSFGDGDKEENERAVFDWLNQMQMELGITTICQYGDYDAPYIIERAKVMNSNIGTWNYKHGGTRPYFPRHIFKAIQVVDIEKFYQRFIEGSVMATGRKALQWMGIEEKEYGKVNRVAIDYMFLNDPERLAIYNIWDCVLPDRCMKKCGELLDIHEGVCDYMGCSVNNWSHPMNQWESIIMLRLKNEILLPSIDSVIRDAGMEAGGHVEGNPRGIFKNMVELDNSGEYNAMVMSCNMDYYTLVEDQEAISQLEIEGVPMAIMPSGRAYRLDIEGVIPSILKEMNEGIMEYKRQIKVVKAERTILYKDPAGNKTEIYEMEDLLEKLDRQKYILKSGTLSSTGLQGTTSEYKKDGKERKRPFRAGHGGIGSDVTEGGREHEKWNKEYINSHNLYYDKQPDGTYDMLIFDAKDKVAQHHYENSPGAILELYVLYQDSVGKDSEIPVVINGDQSFKKIEDLFTEVSHNVNGKEYCDCNGIQVLTIDDDMRSIFRPIKSLMRHKTTKKMYRANLTNHWHLDVTEDHSLIGYAGTTWFPKLEMKDRLVKIKPDDFGDKIRSLITIKNLPPIKAPPTKEPEEFYELLGFFIGDGFFTKGYYIGLSCGLDKDEFIKKVMGPLFGQFINHIVERKKGDIEFNGLEFVGFIETHFKDLHSGKKTIPEWMLKENDTNISSFLRGLFSADGTVIRRNCKSIIRFTNTDDSIIDMTRKLLWRIGISNSVFKETNPNKYNGIVAKTPTYSKHIVVKDQRRFKDLVGFIFQRKADRLNVIKNDSEFQYSPKRNVMDLDFDLSTVQSIEEIEYDDYVYDIEVDDTHRFFANGVLVHNTDSCKCRIDGPLPDLDNDGMKEFLTHLGEKYCEYLNKSFDIFAKQTFNIDKHYLLIKLDAVYKVYVQWGANKHYVYKDFEGKVHYRGVKIRKRDVMPFAKEFMIKFFDIVTSEDDIDQIKNRVSELLQIYESDIIAGKYVQECGAVVGVHTEGKNYDSLMHSNTIFGKGFKLGDAATFFYAKSILGKPLPSNHRVALEYGDNPADFDIKLDYKKILEKLKNSMKTILTCLGEGVTWESVRDGYSTSSFEDDDDTW